MGSRPSCSTTATAAISTRTGRRSTRGRTHTLREGTSERAGDGGTAADRGATSTAGRVGGAAVDDGDRAPQLPRVFHLGGLPASSLPGAAAPVAPLLALPVPP